jgi:hypothetical protein
MIPPTTHSKAGLATTIQSGQVGATVVERLLKPDSESQLLDLRSLLDQWLFSYPAISALKCNTLRGSIGL